MNEVQPEENGTTEGKFDETYEKCVLCGCKIDLKKNVLIEFRDNYIEGCGQLCYNCFDRLNNLETMT